MSKEKKKKKEVKGRARGVKNFDPEKQQWHKNTTELRRSIRSQGTSSMKSETSHQTPLLPFLMEFFGAQLISEGWSNTVI